METSEQIGGPPSSGPQPETLDYLLAPHSVEEFVEHYWTTRPLRVVRSNGAYLQRLFSLHELDDAISSSGPRSPRFRALKSGREINLRAAYAKHVTHEDISVHYRLGGTVVAQFLEERNSKLTSLCNHIASRLIGPVGVNVYMTPPGGVGLPPHFDAHDVIVAQLHGQKSWRLYDWDGKPPPPGEHFRPGDTDPDGPRTEFTLGEGDVLYVPRGMVHAAEALTTHSVHLTIGIRTPTWHDVLLAWFEEEVKAASGLGEVIPHDTLVSRATIREVWRDKLEHQFEWVDAESVFDIARRHAMSGFRQRPSGRFSTLFGSAHLGVWSEFEVREHDWSEIDYAEDHATIRFGGKEVLVPAAFEPEIRYLSGLRAPTTVAGMESTLDFDSRLQLVRSLLDEGWLRLLERRDTR